MGNESSVPNKNSVSSLPPISCSPSMKVARRSSDQRQNQVQNNPSPNLLPHRHSTSNTHLNSIPSYHLEPQRKYSQCQPEHQIEDLSRQLQRHNIGNPQCSLSASHSAYSYRNRASFASAEPTPTNQSPLSASPNFRHAQFSNFYANSPYPQHTNSSNRRMSVDESQQRRQIRTPTSTVKLSLAGLNDLSVNSTNQMSDDQSSTRSKSSKSFREESDTTSISLQEHLKLTSYQTLMLTQTWPRIKPSVFNNVFKELSQKCPKVKELFQKTTIVGGFSSAKSVDMKEHNKQLIDLYDASLLDLTGPYKSVQEKCLLIGETHFAIAAGSSGIWDDFGVCLTEAISKAEAVRGKREAFKAYIALTSFLVDSMKAGYMAQAKRKSLSRTANGQSTQGTR